MAKSGMTDIEAVYGAYKPTICEWIGPNNERCDCKVIKGKSYCKTHYPRVFKVISEEEFEEFTEQQLEESEDLENIEKIGENEWQ